MIQSLDCWVSTADIGAGARWSAEVGQALQESKIGILCVTPENQQAPWLLFEAGALAKTLTDTFVCPYLIGMKPSDLVGGPLTQFQAKVADKEGTFDLAATINRASGAEALSEERLRRLFERSWLELEKRLARLPAAATSVEQPDQNEMISEIDRAFSLTPLARQDQHCAATRERHRRRRRFARKSPAGASSKVLRT